MQMPTREQKQSITEEIFKKTQKSMNRAGFSRDKIARELQILAFSDIKDYISIDGETGQVTGKPLDELKVKSKAIRKIKQKRRFVAGSEDKSIVEETEFELYNKLDALQFAAGIMGMEKPKQIELTGKDGTPLVPAPDLLLDFGGKNAG